MTTMLAAQLRGVVGSGDVVVRTSPVPEPGPASCSSGCCAAASAAATSHFVFDGTAQTAYTPIVLGHEPVGVVAGRSRHHGPASAPG